MGATFVATHLLGPETAGLVFLSYSLVSIASAISRMGFDHVLVRKISVSVAQENWSDVRGVWRFTARRVLLLASAIAGAILLTATLVATHVMNKPELGFLLQIMAPMVPSLAIGWLAAQALIGLGKPEQAALVQNMIVPLMFVAGVTSLSLYGLDSKWVGGLSYLIASAASVAVAIGALFANLRPAAEAPVDRTEIWTSAKPLWLVLIASQFISWGTPIAAGPWLSSTEIAAFTVAQRSVAAVSVLLSVVNTVLAPRYATLFASHQTNELRRLTRVATLALTCLATIIAVGVHISAASIAQISGATQADVASSLRILMIGQWVNVATGSVGVILAMSGNERDLRNVTLIAAALSLSGTSLLSCFYGLHGAAIATAVSLAGQNIALFFLVKRRLGFYTVGKLE